MSPRFAFIIVLASMSMYLAFQAYSLRAISSMDASATARVVGSQPVAKQSRALNLKEVARLNLMGAPYAKDKQPLVEKPLQSNLPSTSLKLTLTAVIQSTDENKGSAFIENEKNISNRYFVGDQISSGVTLHAVEEESVILSRNGQLETLRFPASNSIARNQPPQPVKRDQSPAQPANEQQASNQGDYDENGKPSQSLRMRLKRMALEARRKKILEQQGQQQPTQ
ncbi:MAG: hypothetical protein KDI30_00835 [Pseudomonadales bacterium]|nr:hypothetical protein [Pseudomonadales bacterium]